MLLTVAEVSEAAPRRSVDRFKPEPPGPAQYLTAPRDGTQLLLVGAIFDPTVREPDFTLVGLPADADPAYAIVQFKRGQSRAREALAAAGVRFVGYLPDDAFQVRLGPEAAQLWRHTAVRWMGPYQSGYKVHPRLWPGAGEHVAQVTVRAFSDASLEAIRAALAGRAPGATLVEVTTSGDASLRYLVPEAARAGFVAEAARVSGVALIEPYDPPLLANNDSLGPIQSNVPSVIVGSMCTTCSIFNHGLTGTGQIVALADTGNDSDMCYFRYDGAPGSVTDAQSPAPPGTGTIDPTHKIIAYYVQPGATVYDGAVWNFHGTHTSATAAGDNYANLSTPATPGIDVGDGMAPNAKLVFQDIGNEPTGTLALGDRFNLYLQGLNAGAGIHSDSYGATTGGAYTGVDATTDRFLFDHERMALFFAAGNEGPAANTTRSPGNAKNVISVGALGHGNSTTVAFFSSRGPTDDGRTKPDIMAPGQFIVTALGDEDHASGNCGVQSVSGTSDSTPIAAGGSVLLRQYFADGYYPTGTADPADAMDARAPLVKAVLLDGSLPLPAGGVFGGNDYGWGRVFLDNNLYFAGDARELRVWNPPNTDGLQTGGSATYQVTVGAGQEFRAALTWFDPEATPGAGASLVNNLDLAVGDGTSTYLGNVFDASGVSVPGGTPDVVNNVEQVRLTAPLAGNYTITVSAPAVPGNGRPYTDRQGYALVVSHAACATAVTSPPSALAAADHPPMGVDLSWTSAAGSSLTQVYRASGDCSTAAEEFQYIGSSPTAAYTDTRAQGGIAYAYKVRGADGCGEGPPSSCVSIVPSGTCDLKPSFDGLISAVGGFPTGNACRIRLTWTPGASHCPAGPDILYNVYRSTSPAFTPGAANLLTTVTGFTVYDDTSVLGGTTYYYVVRAEDGTTAGGGPHGGNEDPNTVERFATALGPPGALGTFVDGAGDGNAYAAAESPWQITGTQAQMGAYAYHGGPDAGQYPPNVCAALTTPALSLAAGATLSYFIRYNVEFQYDGTVVEISTDGGASWSDLPPTSPAGYPTVFVSEGDSCHYPTTQGVFSGPPGNGGLTPWTQYQTDLSAYAGMSVKVRWRFTSDSGLEFEGFYLDDIQVTSVNLPGACVAGGLPDLAINDVSVTEGNSGTTTAGFTVNLTPTSSQTVTVQYSTADGSATAGTDYVATTGTVTFPPGSPSQPVSATVNGDTQFEGNESFFVNLSNASGAIIGDAQGQGTILNDDGTGGGSTFIAELTHGFDALQDLASAGGAANNDFYSISQKPYSSYEVVVDATSGDIGPALNLERVGPDGTTVLQVSQPIGVGFSESLRWANDTAGQINDQSILVKSAGCTTDCGPDDVYNIHAFETTYSVPRFNNSGTQITVLLLQNPTNYAIAGNVYFWTPAGALVGTQAFNLAADATLVLNTSTVAPGVAGTVTVTHNGRYGDLSGKTVALEPATGFSFDSPMLPRLR